MTFTVVLLHLSHSEVTILVVSVFCIRAETNTQVLIKDFDNRIVKLVHEYSLRSHDPAHMMHLPSGSDTMKAIDFDWHNFLLGTLTSVL